MKKKEPTIETLVNYFISFLIVVAFIFVFAKIGIRLTEVFCPCCFGCASCYPNGLCCLIPIIFIIFGLGLGLSTLIELKNYLEKKHS